MNLNLWQRIYLHWFLGKVIDLLNTKQLMEIASNEAVKIFGRPYLQKNFSNLCTAHGIINNGDVFQFFIGIKGQDELPDREADDHGWVVYGNILVDAITGKVKEKEYVLE